MKTDSYFELKNVSRSYFLRRGLWQKKEKFNALSNVSFTIQKGSWLGIAGESGSGKSTLAKLLSGLVKPTEGKIYYQGQLLEQVLKNKKTEFHHNVQIIFQNPYLSLSPHWAVEKIVGEGIRNVFELERKKRIEECLTKVGLPLRVLKSKARSLSGGERQRVAIARALVMKPEYLILDEPTSQLDVTTQAQFIKLMRELRPVFSAGILFISHDLALISQLVSEIAIFSNGVLIEKNNKSEIIRNPQHAETRKLINSIL